MEGRDPVPRGTWDWAFDMSRQKHLAGSLRRNGGWMRSSLHSAAPKQDRSHTHDAIGILKMLVLGQRRGEGVVCLKGVRRVGGWVDEEKDVVVVVGADA